MLMPLKTLKGSRIWYSKFGIGKQVGSKIYVHISQHDKIISNNIWEDAVLILKSFGYKLDDFNCICYDLHDPVTVRFDEAKGFDTEREPVIDHIIKVNTVKREIYERYSSQIWHHKWLWVTEDYSGFNVQESYKWSKLWLSKLNEVASGSATKWKKQLEKIELK